MFSAQNLAGDAPECSFGGSAKSASSVAPQVQHTRRPTLGDRQIGTQCIFVENLAGAILVCFLIETCRAARGFTRKMLRGNKLRQKWRLDLTSYHLNCAFGWKQQQNYTSVQKQKKKHPNTAQHNSNGDQ